jgi:hypothetical protein
MRAKRVSVLLSACSNAAVTGRIFVKFGIGGFYEICRENQDFVIVGEKNVTMCMNTPVHSIVACHMNSP